MSQKEDFARSLIKGKIAETVFAQMLRESRDFTVLEFGYEKVIPDLVQQGYEKNEENDDILELIRTAPDFAVINRKTKEVHLIEVKYRHTLRKDEILKIALRMHDSWNPSYLFVANDKGFYFDEIGMIIKNEGKITPLVHPQIPAELQQKFLRILNDFEGISYIDSEELEHLIVDAKRLIEIADGRHLNTAYFQKCLKIGYGKAAKLRDELEERGLNARK
jgi:DNA segregation ATPase FtsK/SpoIIIE-like protein